MIYFIYILLSVVFLFAVYVSIETHLLEVNKHQFSSDLNDLKIIHLSDIHIRFMRISKARLTRVFETEKPDLILLSGDYISSRKHIPAFMDFLDGIIGHCPIYACLGNHEIETYPDDAAGLEVFVSLMEGKGVNVLRDSTATFVKNEKTYRITGLDGHRYAEIDKEELIANSDPDSVNIVLAHNPDTALQIPEGTADYLFCGHFHGGQIWMPFNLEFFLLRKEKLCRMGMKRGLHDINGIKVYINRGLGCVVFPFRFLSIPEIAVFIL